ncbi:hypothetical protein ACEWY4_024738 [Coilia grayii]|uniref:Zona pellucida sperm-binding protein 3 n=1 Tax=Coilia grayii TaxID=363190 RepID=A0ABD1IVU9_9TELE
MSDSRLKDIYSCFQATVLVFTLMFTVSVISKNTLLTHKLENSERSGKDNARIGDLSKTGLEVECGEKNWKITVRREFFGRGVPFSPNFIRLGEDLKAHGPCAPQMDLLTSTQMVLHAGLQDCGSISEVNDDWLIYTNKLVFTPAPFQTRSGSVIQRGVPKVVPLECHYKRKQTVSGDPLTPTWLPMTSTVQAAGLLNFSLRVIRDDWRSVRSSTVFLQGEPVFLEAVVFAPLHPSVRVYVDYCVATLNPEPLSRPRYEFITNHGCLVDRPMPSSSSSPSPSSSSSSQFAPRDGVNSLRFSIPAFHFTQDPQSQSSQHQQVFINCRLRAVPQRIPPDPLNKACFLHQPSSSWRSVDGADAVCSCCATGDCHVPTGNTRGIASTLTALPTTGL